MHTPFSALAKRYGFIGLDSKVHWGLKNLSHELASSTAWEEDSLETIRAILSTLDDLTHSLSLEKQHKSEGTKRKIQRAKQRLCQCCGDLTEYSAYLKPKNLLTDDDVLRADLREGRHFSSKYCKKHRSHSNRSNDTSSRTSNSLHKRVKRTLGKFEQEARRLELLNWGIRNPSAGSGDLAIDCYMHYLSSREAYYLDDQELIRNRARALIDGRITDRKKIILVLPSYGWAQTRIAKALSISRQAVSQVLKRVQDRDKMPSVALLEIRHQAHPKES